MASRSTEYLIIGNSAAGIAAAEAIREASPEGIITIVGDEPYPAYGRPLISYLIEGKTTQDDIWLRDADFYDSNGIDALLGPDFKVETLNPQAHEAVLANGDVVSYGKCLLATGSVPFVPPIEGLGEGSNVFSFMSLDDAKRLQNAVEKAAEDRQGADAGSVRVVVVGAGLIGLKAAEAVSHYVDEVLVLELAPRILPAVLDEQGASVLQRRLEREGILCRPGVSASSFAIEDGRAVKANLTDGSSVDCDVVVAAVGVRPNSALAVDAGAQQGRGLVCDESLCTSLPDVYAAGDVVQVTDALDGSQHPLALWPNAVRQGRCAGLHMAGSADASPYKGDFAVNAVDFFDASLLTSGVINPPADSAEYQSTVFADDESYAKFVTRDGRLVGYILLNRPDNAGIYTSLIESGADVACLDPEMFKGSPQNLCLSEDVRWERLHRGYPSCRNELGWTEE